MGLAVISGRFPLPHGSRGAPPDFPPFLGWFLVAFGLAFCLGFLALATALILAGSFLRQRRRWTFCLVMAALSCAWFPFGTVLGVLTILVLARPEVKARFQASRPFAPA